MTHRLLGILRHQPFEFVLGTLVIGVGFNFADAMKLVAADYPKTNFAIIDSVVDQPNVASLTFAEEQGSYLVGAIAAQSTKSDTVGASRLAEHAAPNPGRIVGGTFHSLNPNDDIAGLVTQLGKTLGQPVVVDAKTGASGMVAATFTPGIQMIADSVLGGRALYADEALRVLAVEHGLVLACLALVAYDTSNARASLTRQGEATMSRKLRVLGPNETAAPRVAIPVLRPFCSLRDLRRAGCTDQ